MGALWHGFADMGAVERDGAFVVARGAGAYVWDRAGNRYLDATAGLWFTNVGHGRREIADAVAAQLSELAHYSNFGDITAPVTQELARRLAELAPVPGSKIMFTSGGSDSVDTAAKLARRFWRELGRPDKTLIVGRRLAYHGMHVAGTALGGIAVNREGYGELMADARTVEWHDPRALRELIDEVGAERIAAFFCEPVIGAGGVYPPPEGYLAEVRRLCREHDILFVADEVVTGFGRIGGSWFASSRFGLEPDLMTTAKGLTSGYLPMGAVFAAPWVAEPFFSGGVWFRHGYTYGGHAGAAAAAMANLDIIEREHLLDASKNLETLLHEHFSPLAAHPRVAEVRSGGGGGAAGQRAAPPPGAARVRAVRAPGGSGGAAGPGAR
ncbi:aspartate aminotransferase family protein, partial [Nocardia wallacei]|uniref:aminotransferase family protein n=1 Tax=Nocardia wallacei TaxID=480035 RepID=UPI002456D759